MTAADVITELHRRGVQLEAAGDKLRFRPKEAVTPDLLALLVQHKPGILAALSGDGLLGLCPGQEKCKGCYRVANGIYLHPPRSSEDWGRWFERWSPTRRERLQ